MTILNLGIEGSALTSIEGEFSSVRFIPARRPHAHASDPDFFFFLFFFFFVDLPSTFSSHASSRLSISVSSLLS